MSTVAESDIVFAPAAATVAGSQLTAFMRFCEVDTGRPFVDHADFHQFSVHELDRFWSLFLRWSQLLRDGRSQPVCTDQRACEQAVFFPKLELSYAENLLRIDGPDDLDRPALVALHGSRPPERLTRGDLRDEVSRVAAGLRTLGVDRGDRVVAVASNNAEAVVAGLATAALGATFSAVAPDMGSLTMLSRFEQLEPKVLLANLGLEMDTASTALSDRVRDVVLGLPSLTAVVALDGGPAPGGLPTPVHRLSELGVGGGGRAARPEFARLPFNHPLFIVFSSGTTGRPKCIVHGAGGTLLEHVKEHRLHVDLRPGDKLFFQTSAAWMMWNWQLSALASGAEIVLYDGPVSGPDSLWRLVETERVTVFGTSPPYLQLCQDSNYSPRLNHALPALRAVLSTGSILHDEQYDWVRDHVGAVPLHSISGGTDILGCFMLGNPNLPVRRGQIQCLSLGLDVRAAGADARWDAQARSEIGELVCGAPFPSRPLGFVGDRDGRRFHEAYFSQNPGVWTHGDLIEIGSDGQVRMHGRSDGVLNVQGQRIGPTEIYRVLRDMPEIGEAMAVEQQTPDRPEPARIVLLVILRQPGSLDGLLAARIRRQIGRSASPAHVPGLVVEVDELPSTYSGKRSERAARDALNGVVVNNAESLSNPGALDKIRESVARAEEQRRRQAIPARSLTGQPIETQLRAIWEEVLDFRPLRSDDSFFEVGGTSLRAVRLLNAIHERFSVDLPLSTLFHAQTTAAMASVIEGYRQHDLPLVSQLRPGNRGRPLFIIHGVSGDFLELRPLLLRLSTDRPVYAVRARGLDPRAQPHTRVEEMAEAYIDQIRGVQATGPYALAGYSFGGLVAFEMARRLVASGQQVDSLTLIDTHVHRSCLTPRSARRARRPRALRVMVRAVRGPRAELTRLLRRRARKLAPAIAGPASALSQEPLPPLIRRLQQIGQMAQEAYCPASFPGRMTFIRADVPIPDSCDPLPIWSRVVEQGLTVEFVPGGHSDMLTEPRVQLVAERLAAQL